MNENHQMQEIAARRRFVDHMLEHTVQLVRIENGKWAPGDGSGIFYSREQRLFLFSVLHVFRLDNWYVQTNTEVHGRSLLIAVAPVNWLSMAKLERNRGIRRPSSDGLAWVELDVDTLSRKLAADKSLHGRAVSLRTYCGTLAARPTSQEPYGFVSAPQREIHDCPGGKLVREPLHELDLEYVGDDKRGFYRFRVAGDHRGDSYKGSSGAPIADQEGTIVALVQGGCATKKEIYGVPLACFARAIDMQIA